MEATECCCSSAGDASSRAPRVPLNWVRWAGRSAGLPPRFKTTTDMATITTHRFTHPGILRTLHPEILMHWLAPAFAWLEGKGIVRESEKNRIDHDRLALLFLEPEPTMPEYLLDSAFLIQEMSDTEGMDLILEAQERLGLKLDLPDDPTPME